MPEWKAIKIGDWYCVQYKELGPFGQWRIVPGSEVRCKDQEEAERLARDKNLSTKTFNHSV